ncbi:MAG: hypothetical protein KF760_28430 [Candidatus Eremiobacteraeota bacterium]|nr:hypothetical protein [Candidatus Eremiobacteraeota bacterium]MCW5865824.1 hypothetical protein [Candidatus Eremiobacteraeota bacterium]
MKALALALILAALPVAAERPLKWSVSVGSSGGFTGGGRTSIIRSSGDIITEKWETATAPHDSQVTGYVNQEELDLIERLLADPNLHKAQASKPGNMSRFLQFHYGEIKKTFTVEVSEPFPEPVERLSREISRALSAAKQEE